MGWCLANPQVISVIPGASSRAQLESNMNAGVTPLTAEVKAQLDAASDELKAAIGNQLDIYQGPDTQRSF
jgi:aryl-alcohol dehydrogenase-like predicted oxidoreductase